jgi:hypothetical protein
MAICEVAAERSNLWITTDPVTKSITVSPISESPANPKQFYGDKKLPLYLVPFSFVAHTCIALYEGMRKYGLVNWRAAPVEAMTYVSALERHVKKWTNGERCDPETKVHHLANAAACCCILLDAEAHGSLIDNRPLPNAGMGDLISELETTLAHLKVIFADRNPKHYTIADASPTSQ